MGKVTSQGLTLLALRYALLAASRTPNPFAAYCHLPTVFLSGRLIADFVFYFLAGWKYKIQDLALVVTLMAMRK